MGANGSGEISKPPTHWRKGRVGNGFCGNSFKIVRYVCVCVQLGMYASPRYVTIPTPPTQPPTHHPPNPKVCVYRWVPKNTLCVQMSQICVCRWGFWSVCTDESNLCAQMSPLPSADVGIPRTPPWSLTYVDGDLIKSGTLKNPRKEGSLTGQWVTLLLQFSRMAFVIYIYRYTCLFSLHSSEVKT